MEPEYSDLLLIVLASILPEIGNTVKDGNCVRYKNSWNEKEKRFSSETVKDVFFERAKIFREDIEKLEDTKLLVNNADVCFNQNALQSLPSLLKESFDAIIASPPYLNSFDYTDVYMPELWALGYVTVYENVRELLRSTFCSHVQVKWDIGLDSLFASRRDRCDLAFISALHFSKIRHIYIPHSRYMHFFGQSSGNHANHKYTRC